jgi:hypothetical protein
MVVQLITQSLPIAGSLTKDRATFYQEDATSEGMTKQSDSWNLWGSDDDE